MPASPPGNSDAADVPLAVGLLCFAIALGYYLWAVSAGWDHTIDEVHRWRQAQTAITAFHLVDRPFTLAYETPIYGPPWSAPMEFPLMQFLTARVSTWCGLALEPAGRAVSVAFHLALLFPAGLILASLRVAVGLRFVALGLWLVSPFYVFWSRTFMIESAALFPALAFVACCFRCPGRGGLAWLVAAAICGGLAAVMKITTFAAFAVVGAGVALFSGAGDLRVKFARLAVLAGVPIAALLWWTRFGDRIKAENPLTRGLVSGALHEWNFGTLAQRFSVETWHVILNRISQLVAPLTPWVCWPLLAALCFLACRVGTRWRAILGCAACFFLPPALFTNLHRIHDYYLYASGIFLSAAMILSALSLLERPRWRLAGWGVFALVALGSVAEYFEAFRPIQLRNSTSAREVGRQIRDRTEPDMVNLLLSGSGDPIHAYYSERRALMLGGSPSDDELREILARLRGLRLGGIFVEPTHTLAVEKVTAVLREQGWPDVAVFPLTVE